MQATTIVQLTHSQSTFTQLVDCFVTGLRRRMFVPDHADDEVEAEFTAFRSHLETRYYPEFCERFAGALSEQLGRGQLEELLPKLSLEAAQRYLEAASPIQQELEQSLPALTQKLTATAQQAVSGSAAVSTGSAPGAKALRLAQSTGVHQLLSSVAQAVSPEARIMREALLAQLVAFYARLFIRHVGEQHAAAVVTELEAGALPSYLRARNAMKPALDRGLLEMVGSMTREVF
jgi:hypothetical protein